MIKKYNLILIIFVLNLCPKVNLAQSPDLGILNNFIFFTKTGAISNTGTSIIKGDFGTNAGAISGFTSPTVVNGTMHTADATVQLASVALDTMYNKIMRMSVTDSTHTPTFGGETLLPGVYTVGAAGSIAGNLTLNANGNSNAIFVLRFWGAFTAAARTSVILTNGAQPCNVFWIAEGSISLATYTTMKGVLLSHNGAIALGAACNLEGRIFSTSGALSVYGVIANIPFNSSPISTTWTGAQGSSNWFDPLNWSNEIPQSYVNVFIPATLPSPNVFPVINTGVAALNLLTLPNGASLTVTNAILQISNNLNATGLLDVSLATVVLCGINQQTIPGNVFVNNNILNLVINNNVTLTGQQNVTGVLSFTGSNNTLTTNGLLNLRSTALGTARLADITNGGINTGNVIIGNVTIERYIPAKRAWRLLSIPVAASGAPSINAAWQEGLGGTKTKFATSYGTQITGGSAASGFDQGINSNASIKVFSNSTNTLVALPSALGTNIPVTNYPGYFLFVRGDRNTNLMQGANALNSVTTLQIQGNLNTGNVVTAVNAAGLTLVGNPYPSPVDFSTITKNNVADVFYVWDATLGGTAGYGGYVTVSGNNGSYNTVPGNSAVSKYIASGSAFFIQTTDGLNAGELTFKETDKNAGAVNNVFREASGVVNLQGKLNADLFGTNADSSVYLIDGVLTTYDDNSNNAVDRSDVNKIYNLAEVVVIDRSNHFLSIERRHSIASNDTTSLNLYRLKHKAYQIKLTAQGFDNNGLSAILIDKYAAANNNITINLNGVTVINFIVNTDSASFAANRFSVIFKRTIPAIVTFTGVKAYCLKKDIVVTWNNITERDVKSYEVQEQHLNSNLLSTFENSFTRVSTLFSKTTIPGSESYSWLDVAPAAGTHYYRIKATNLDGKVTYSNMVQASIEGIADTEPAIAVYGNIVKGNTVTLEFKNIAKGNYTILLYNIQGQFVKEIIITHAGGVAALHTFSVDNNLAAGLYQLQLTGKSLNLKASVVKQ